MIMHVPPERQGQAVEVSYGGDGSGTVYRRTRDRSDRSESWERAEFSELFPDCASAEESAELWQPHNAEPEGDPDAWTPCSKPEEL